MFSNRRSEPSTRDIPSTPDFRALFDQYWIPICQVLYRLLGDWDDAQDLALETFTRLATNPPPTSQNLPGWLYRVATRLGFNRIRDQKRRRIYEERARENIWSDSSSSNPELDVEQCLEQQIVRCTLQVIKPRSASLLLLRYSGLSYQEIAKALNIPPGSIGTLLTRAEREFEREYLNNEERTHAED